MKRVLLSLIALSAVVVTAQEKVVQSGTPALLEAANGKKLKVMLQKLEGDTLTFQPFKSTKDVPVPISKITSLQFFPKYDAEATKAAFIAGDVQTVIDTMAPLMGEYLEYMPIQNNMREAFVLTYNCYRSLGELDHALKYAEILAAFEDEDLKRLGQVGLALIAIEKQDLATAEKVQSELGEDAMAASLFLKASIERAKGDPKQAIQTVTIMIEDHGNDLEWLPPGELLIAHCYLDMTGTNSVISTNSALNTARQVKNMYAGSAVAVNAEKLWTELGGPAIEAEENARKAERAAREKELKEKRAAEAKAKKEAAKAEKAAKAAEAARAAEAAKAAETDVSKNSKTESE